MAKVFLAVVNDPSYQSACFKKQDRRSYYAPTLSSAVSKRNFDFHCKFVGAVWEVALPMEMLT